MDKNTNYELSIYEKLAFSVINLYMSLEEKKRLEKETIYSDSALREVISNAVCWYKLADYKELADFLEYEDPELYRIYKKGVEEYLDVILSEEFLSEISVNFRKALMDYYEDV